MVAEYLQLVSPESKWGRIDNSYSFFKVFQISFTIHALLTIQSLLSASLFLDSCTLKRTMKATRNKWLCTGSWGFLLLVSRGGLRESFAISNSILVLLFSVMKNNYQNLRTCSIKIKISNSCIFISLALLFCKQENCHISIFS